jgi:hypothetical protein
VIAVLLLALVIGIGMWSRFRAGFASIVGFAESATNTTSQNERAWNMTGWLFLIAGFLGLEWMQPYYFTQDDALVGELPGILLGCRSLWDGVFPDWNPYVFLGAPLATMGFWSITYPPQWIAYGIARHVLADEFATLEVFAALHLIAGFIAMRHLSRRIGMGGMTANVAALSLVFAGCILIMGRSWHAFVANAVWLPLLGIAIQRFREGPVGWRWIGGVGLVFGLAYHAGFPQIVALLGMFFILGIATVALAERMALRRIAPVAPALILGVGLAAPLLLHHLQMAGGVERFAPVEDGSYDDLHGALLPYPLAATGFPTPWGSFHVEKMGHFYFFGGLFAAVFALHALAFYLVWPDRRAWGRAWWVPCGIFALLMVLGDPAYLWQGVAGLPMSKFFLRYTIRFYPWLAFCAILSGGLLLERILAKLQQRSIWEWSIGGGLLVVLAYHLAMCQPSFYSYGFRPYPPLPDEFEAVFHPHEDKSLVDAANSQRMASWSQIRSPSADWFASLPLNLPHYYRVPSILGYDPVVEGQPRMAEVNRRIQEDPIRACKAYGVGWHLVRRSETPEHSPNQRFFFMEKVVPHESAGRELLKADLPTIAAWRGTALKQLQGVDPLAFATRRPDRALPMRLHCRGADIDVGGLPAGTPITVNFLCYPQMMLTLDGQQVDVNQDDWQRITTTLPTQGSTLSLRFQPPWRWTCCVGAVLCLGAALLAWAIQRGSHFFSLK